jgi:hypothetical protein
MVLVMAAAGSAAASLAAGCGGGSASPGGTGGSPGGPGGCAPLLDCNGDGADACEVDPRTSADNCGACGHSCLGGTCQAGRCQPMVIAPLTRTWDLKVQNDLLVMVVQNGVGTMPKIGTSDSPAILAQSNQPIDLEVAGGRVYWGDLIRSDFPGGDRVLSIPLAAAGATPTVEREEAFFPCGFASDGTNLLWLEQEQRRLYIKPLAGGAPTAQEEVGESCAVAADAGYVAWIDRGAPLTATGRVLAMEAGGAIRPVAERQLAPIDVALNATHVYWAEEGDFYETYADGTIKRAARSGGTPQVIAMAVRQPIALALDATHVYWIEKLTSRIRRAPLAGGTAETVAEVDAPPIALALDETAVYFNTRIDDDTTQSNVYRVAK